MRTFRAKEVRHLLERDASGDTKAGLLGGAEPYSDSVGAQSLLHLLASRSMTGAQQLASVVMLGGRVDDRAGDTRGPVKPEVAQASDSADKAAVMPGPDGRNTHGARLNIRLPLPPLRH
jgi:hypothetical protein